MKNISGLVKYENSARFMVKYESMKKSDGLHIRYFPWYPQTPWGGIATFDGCLSRGPRPMNGDPSLRISWFLERCQDSMASTCRCPEPQVACLVPAPILQRQAANATSTPARRSVMSQRVGDPVEEFQYKGQHWPS